MKTSWKRLTALVLALSMAMSLLCTSAWAGELDMGEDVNEPVAESMMEESDDPSAEIAEEDSDASVLEEDEAEPAEAPESADQVLEEVPETETVDDEPESPVVPTRESQPEALESSPDTEHFPASEGAAVAKADQDAPLVRAGETATVQLDVTYCQTEARSILDMVNDFRTGDDAWYWNSDNTTKTVCTDLSKLSYDYELEKVAMQRAAEIALSFSHTRTNGELCWTAYDEAGYTYTAAGENIAAGYTSAQSVFEGWAEEDEDYSGQGHRRNMLSADVTAIGIACVYYNGYYYWVQEFAAPGSSSSQATKANDAKTTVQVDILLSDATISAAADPSSLTVVCGKSANLPALNTTVQMSNAWPARASKVSGDYTWSIADGQYATLSGNTVTGVKKGSTTLKATVLGKTVSVPLTVAADISKCTVSLSKASYVYNGTARTPGVTVKDGDTSLTEKQDYTVSYKNNTNAGTATVTVTGKGNYAGTVTTTFTITQADNTITASGSSKTYSAKKQTFSLKATQKGTGKLTYSSNDKSVTVSAAGKVTIKAKFIGKATITINAAADNNYKSASKSITIKVIPTKTTLSSVTNTKGKKLTVKWKKNTVATGYEIQYSTDKTFKKSVTTKKVTKKTTVSKTYSGLKKGKKYYVRIRTYTTVSGTKYYSGWSGKKNVTIKK